VDLKEKLMKAGVVDMFSQDKANFATISDTKLAIENVIHIAKIKVEKNSIPRKQQSIGNFFIFDCWRRPNICKENTLAEKTKPERLCRRRQHPSVHSI
jgi:hypothetical protein